MKIEQKSVTVKEIFDGYVDKGDDGVFAFGGRLAIRPAYQREFVYDKKQAEAVIHTILNGYPLNVMYWVRTGADSYEVLDGQQRTLSVMQYLDHKSEISMDGKTYYWDSLPDDLLQRLLSYPFMVYVCEGTESEKLAWFRIVNIAGERLTDQEIRNISYTGPWLSDAKLHFSKRNCAAKNIAKDYISGDPNRQELLEKALKGVCEHQGMRDVTDYMSVHKSDANADELWQYFQDAIHWVQKTFPTYYADMKGVDWLRLYNQYGGAAYNSAEMASEVRRLHEDDDVQKTRGIYEYLLCRATDPYAARLLELRAFDKRDRMAAYSRQNGLCAACGRPFRFEDMEGDHIVPWSKGGHTVPENCQMLCRPCNAKKKDRY